MWQISHASGHSDGADSEVSGTVWLDANQNGKQDSTEHGESFVTVELYTAGSSSPLQTTQTDSDGHYSFGMVAAGDYTITVILSDYEFAYTTPNRGDDDMIDSDVDLGGETEPFTVDSVPVVIDAGFISILDTISPVQGMVWLDADENGQRGAAETPLSNITVTLYFSGTSQLFFIQESTTDAAGAYELPGISMGDYLIEFTLPNTTSQFTTPNVGDDESTDSDVDPTSSRTATFFHDGVVQDTRFDAGMITTQPLAITLSPIHATSPYLIHLFILIPFISLIPVSYRIRNMLN